MGRGAHPGPPAWRVGKGGCNGGLLGAGGGGGSVSLFVRKRDCSLGHQKSGWYYRS